MLDLQQHLEDRHKVAEALAAGSGGADRDVAAVQKRRDCLHLVAEQPALAHAQHLQCSPNACMQAVPQLLVLSHSGGHPLDVNHLPFVRTALLQVLQQLWRRERRGVQAWRPVPVGMQIAHSSSRRSVITCGHTTI
jgi:hypothetical protein